MYFNFVNVANFATCQMLNYLERMHIYYAYKMSEINLSNYHKCIVKLVYLFSLKLYFLYKYVLSMFCWNFGIWEE